MNTGEVLIKVISGGTVGYISSLFALKLFLGKYSLINDDSNYLKLETNLGDVLEQNLLKNRLINSQINRDDFKKQFDLFINDLIENSLSSNIPDITLKELDSYDDLKNNLNNFLLNNQSFIENINLEKIINFISIKDLLTDSELKSLAGKVYQILSSTVLPNLKPMISDFYDEIKDKKIEDVFNDDSLNKIKNNINPLLDELKKNIKNVEPELDTAIKSFWQEINADEILEKLENNIKEKTIIDFIGSENKDKLTSELINHFIEFINSDEGKGFLLKLSDSLLTMTKEVDLPVLNFLMPVLQVRVFNFIENNMPYLAENAKEWLRINKKEIDQIIEDSIEEYYTTQNIMGQLKLTVKDIIGLKISEYFQIVEKGIEKFENYINKNASHDLTLRLVDFLENKKIGDIFTQLNIKTETLADFFHVFINNYLPKINTKIFDSLLNKQIGTIKGLFKTSLKEQFGDKIENMIVLKAKDFLLSDYIIDKVKSLVPEKFEGFKTSTIESILPKEKLEGYLGFLPMLLMFSQGKIIDSIYNEINKNIVDKKPGDLINPEIETNLKNELKGVFLQNTETLVNQVSDLNLKSFYENIPVREFTNSNSNLLKSLEPVIENQIIKEIKDKVVTIPTEQLSTRVENFIGRDYNAIIIISAFIGIACGIAVYFINNSSGLITTPIIYFMLALIISWASLEMIFKPYDRSFASKRKGIFANDISELITQTFKKDNLFNSELQNDFRKNISANNYQLVNEIMLNNNDKISNIFLDKSFSYIDKIVIPERDSKLFVDKISSFEINKINQETFNNAFSKVIDKSENFLNSFITKKLFEYGEKDLNALPEKLRLEIEELIKNKISEKTNNLTGSLNSIDITEQLKDSLDNIEQILNFDVKLSDAYSPDDEVKARITRYISEIIKDKIPEGINKYIQKNFIEGELSPDREINTLFNGELVPFVRKNIYLLIDNILFEFGLEKLKNEKENISQKIINSVRKANKDSLLYGIGESFFSIDKDIEEIVHLIIDTKLESYLKDKKYELEALITGFIDFISRKKLSEIGLSDDILNSENINAQVEKFVNNQNISDSINHMSVALVEDILNLKISFILNMLGINSLKEIPEKLTEQINLIKEQFINGLNNKEGVNNILESFAKDLINKGIFSQKLKPLFNDIETTEISSGIAKITAELYKTEILNSYKNKFSDAIYKNIESKKVSDFINPEILQTQLQTVITNLINDDNFKSEIKELITPLIKQFFSNINIIIPEQMKEYILNIVIKSISDNFKQNSEQIIKELSVKEVMEKSLNNISTEELEKLFDEITAFNIKKSLVYGSIGAIVGIFDAVVTHYYG